MSLPLAGLGKTNYLRYNQQARGRTRVAEPTLLLWPPRGGRPASGAFLHEGGEAKNVARGE